MTDITKLAQREKFEAWWEREYKHLESSKYTDAVPHIKYGFWMAYQAGGAELVEALESEKRICATWRKTAESTSEKLDKAQTINAAAEKLVRCKGRYHSEQNYRALAALFGVNTPELPPLEHENVHYADAAEMEIAALRQRIAELESRTVTVKLPQRLQPGADGWDDWYVHSDDEGEYLKFDDVLAMLTAAGIKVEAE
ncbi:ead/Ea22-like family protein [Klebsiella pneumoniae]|nr:ead/Ea22-like family protein [Klebsiella pneumoniae]